MLTWVCPDCSEEILAPGPMSLKMMKEAHEHEEHGGKQVNGTGPFKRKCEYCAEEISRQTETNLTYAMNGHLMYRHKLRPDGQPLSTPRPFSGERDRDVVSSSTPIDAPVPPPEPFTRYDYKFMAGIKIKW